MHHQSPGSNTYKSAWFLAQRIREAMRSGELGPMGGIVEVDETSIGNKKGAEVKRGWRRGTRSLSRGEADKVSVRFTDGVVEETLTGRCRSRD